MDLSTVGFKDVLFLVGALLGFASAFLIPPKGRRVLMGGRMILSLGLIIVLLGAVLLLLTLISKSDLRWWVNSAGLLALGGVVILGWRRTRTTAPSPVVARAIPGEGSEATVPPPAGTAGAPSPTVTSPAQQTSASPKGSNEAVKVACPSCGAVITVEASSSWIKCPRCGLEGRIGG